MSQVHHIKSRIGSARNVGQITKAMELVSATKMRRAQEVALRSRPYAFAALELLEVLSRHGKETIFSKPRDINTTLVVIIESDKGLTGSFNTQVERRAGIFFSEDAPMRSAAHTYVVMPIGAKARHFAEGRFPLAEIFSGTGDYVSLADTRHIVDAIVGGFTALKWDRVVVISTHFRTTLVQEAVVRELLPVTSEHVVSSIKQIIPEHGRFSSLKGEPVGILHDDEYIFEPSPEILLERLMPHLITMQLYHSILEANASEHSARRVAMKTASDNADTLVEDLTLQYNKARQAGITNELIEIASTQEALA
jgi:F-type H+-transporting ATPase subunit gamma